MATIPWRGRRLAAVLGGVLLLPGGPAAAQRGPVNGMRPADLRAHAIVGATVVVRPGEEIQAATVLIRDGVIEAVGPDLQVPADAWVWNVEGLRVYPGLLDAAVMAAAEREPAGSGDHWSERVHPQTALSAQALPLAAQRKNLREQGFAAAAVYPEQGIIRGSGVVVALAESDEHVLAYTPRAAMAMSFDRGRHSSGGGYPGSLMGAIALIRQTLLDAQWHAGCRRVYEDHSQGHEPPLRADALEALEDVINGRQAVLFDVSDEHNALRAARLAREFDLDLLVLGSGSEYRWLEEIVAIGAPLIIPLRFPEPPEVDTLSAAERVSLRELMSWEQAPTNPRRLIHAGATVALTTHRLKKTADFHPALREAIQHGLSEDEALAALTTTPARILGLESVLGTLDPGKAANLVVVEGSLFEKKPRIRDVWINGRRHEVSPADPVKLVGSGELVTDLGLQWPVTIDTPKRSFVIEDGEKRIKARKVIVEQDRLSLVVEGGPFNAEGFMRLSGILSAGGASGTGELPGGQRFEFSIRRTGDLPAKPEQPVAAAQDGPDREGGREGAAAGAGGTWVAMFDVRDLDEPVSATLELEEQEDGSVRGTIAGMGAEVTIEEGTFDRPSGLLALRFIAPHGQPATLQATINGNQIEGSVDSGDGVVATMRGSRSGGTAAAGEAGDEEEPEEEEREMPPEELIHPLGGYGRSAPPLREDVLVEHATIWTCGPQGILEDSSLLVVGGKIQALGRALPAVPEVRRIDASGRHVTPGLIDCHSHTGIDGGVNEWGQANTAEVRIADVIDPDDVDWYRQLAGGLTAANQLHGSANPIGGQNSVVKLAWGRPAAAYPIADAIAGIKFALGENVKRTAERYPNSRMGVETFIRDAFTAARDYRRQWEHYESLPTEQRQRTMPPRRDLELEALVEILEGQRLVHCHSYRQDEILMLIRLAEEFGFTIGTFQHVLEGYKVAEAIAAHGAGGSTFSDWWAYKMEVMDAIPYNGSLMTEVGVVVSFNSDSGELARRMNTEAAKAVRYGGMARHEALKVVTLNPARQLRIDHRTGSLEVGKDADFVIWSGDPLSTYTRCEQTWVEGACAFDLEEDARMRERDAGERQRLIQKVLARRHGKDAGKKREDDEKAEQPTGAAVQGRSRLLEARRLWAEELIRQGRDPQEILPGRCACNDELWEEKGSRDQGIEGSREEEEEEEEHP